MASILLDVAVGADVVQDLAQVIFLISKNHHSTKPAVILIFFTPGLFQVLPAVRHHSKTVQAIGKWALSLATIKVGV